MKKFLLFVALIATVSTSFAAFINEAPPKKATEIFLPLAGTNKFISLMDLTTISVKEYQSLTGKKLKLTEKIALKITQKKLKKVINKDQTINKEKLAQYKAPIQNKNLRLALIFLGGAIAFAILGTFIPFMWILSTIAALVSAVFFVLWLVEQAE